MSWDSWENENGTVTVCRMEVNEKWGNWGEVVLSAEQFKKWKAKDNETINFVWENLK